MLLLFQKTFHYEEWMVLSSYIYTYAYYGGYYRKVILEHQYQICDRLSKINPYCYHNF